MFTSARVFTDCNWLACTGAEPPCWKSLHNWLMILAMDLGYILSAMGPPCGPFNLENYRAQL